VDYPILCVITIPKVITLVPTTKVQAAIPDVVGVSGYQAKTGGNLMGGMSMWPSQFIFLMCEYMQYGERR
jgi:hypothetical protein